VLYHQSFFPRLADILGGKEQLLKYCIFDSFTRFILNIMCLESPQFLRGARNDKAFEQAVTAIYNIVIEHCIDQDCCSMMSFNFLLWEVKRDIQCYQAF
jgi:hypothetical protein